MSNTVDKRAVELGFDNQQFEAGVKTSVKSLDDLKKGLDLTQQAKSLNSLSTAGKSLNLTPIADGVQNISNKFSALGAIGFTVMQNLTNSVIDFGKKLWSSITAPAKKGFAEYEIQMNAIQTILANTASKGTTLEQVNAILEEMNLYADKTIYNFSEMAKNVGTFTAAGIDLNTAADAIKGIANLAAVSGSNSQQAATAMYQLSQALSTGTVRLMDWNSVVNAGMGGQVFQDALKETARVHGIAIDQIIEDEGSFRESLQQGWLTSEVLTETLAKFTGDLTADQLKIMGYTEDQIAGILKLGQTASDAATKVKTFSQLKETLQESLASGWARTWQLILGDFEEARTLFTYLSDTLGGFIQQTSDSRNLMLENWSKWGGRMFLVDSIKNGFEALKALAAPIKTAFQNIFPSTGLPGFKLLQMTTALKNFTAGLTISGETADKVKRVFKGIFSVFDILGMAISAVFKNLTGFSGGLKNIASGVLNFLAGVGDYLVALRDAAKASDFFNTAMDRIKTFILGARDSMISFYETIKEKFSLLKGAVTEFKEKFLSAFNFKDVDLSGIDAFFDKVKIRFSPLETLVKVIATVIGGLVNFLKKASPAFVKIGTFLQEILSNLGNAIIEGVTNLDFSAVFDTLNSGLMSALILAMRGFVTKGTGVLGSVGGVFEGIPGILDTVRTSLEAWQSNLQAKTLLTIAGAVAILAISLVALAMIDSAKLTSSLLAVTTLFTELIAGMTLLNKGTIGGAAGAAGLALTLIGIGIALLLITSALAKLSTLDSDQLKNGLVSLSALASGIVAFTKVISTNAKSFIGTALSLMIFGVALKIMVDVVNELGNINIDTLQKGLISIGALMAELAVFMQASTGSNMGLTKGLGILALAGALVVMSVAVERLGKLDVNVLQQGLVTIGAILAGVSAFIILTANGKNMITAGIGMAILAGSMLIFGQAISQMGKMSWDEIGRGLATMGGALVLIVAALNLMPKNMIVSAVGLVLIGGALYILAQALTTMSAMSWEEIGKGLVTLAGSLLIITVAMYGMSGALPGALALIVVAGALAILAPVLKTLGSMGINEIALALGALAAMFLILGIAGYALTPVVPTLLGLGAAIFLLGLAVGAIGLGVMLFSTGLATLAVSGAAGAVALVAIIGTILGIIPMIIKALADAIILFATLIGEAAPVIGKALLALLLALCDIIIQGAPKLAEAATVLLLSLIQVIRDVVPDAVDAIIYLITELLKSIALYTPDFVQAAFDILIGFLSGIRDNLAEVVTVVGEIITEFLDAVALELPDIIDSGFNLLISFINGMTAAITENGPELQTAIGELALAIVTGLSDGILGSVQTVVDAIKTLGTAVIDALKVLLGIASPSKVMMDIGKDTAVGFAKGIDKNANLAEDAGRNIAERAASGLSAAIARINDTLNREMDITPTIRPVVDLTDVAASGKTIDNIFGNKAIELSKSIGNVSRTSAGINMRGSTGEKTNQTAGQSGSVVFNQTNVSPKALSAFDIYRNTRNQLLSAKGLIVSP